MLSRLESLYGTSHELLTPEAEEMAFEMKAGPLSGTMQYSLRVETYLGREVYRVTRQAEIINRYVEEESLIDCRGLFPYRYIRKTKISKGEMRVDTVRWDHLGCRLFCESHDEKDDRLVRERFYHELWLGQDVPDGILDPITALISYRIHCIKQGQAPTWTVPILQNANTFYAGIYKPAGKVTTAAPAIAGKSRIIEIEQTWDGTAFGEKTITSYISLALDNNAMPVSSRGRRWGIKGFLSLEKYSSR